jgi:hypothetical protein
MRRLAILILVSVILLPAAAAAVIHVPGDQPTIQAGIDAAVKGDTVLVADGIWTGTGNHNLDFSGKTINVISENGPETCIIDCQDLGRGFHFHSGEDENAIVQGFTIRNGRTIDSSGAGILIDGAAPVISNCIFTDNDAEYPRAGGGIAASGGLIIDCIFSNNRADVGGGLSLSGDTVAENCLIANNFADEGGGGLNTGLEGNPLVRGCTITNNLSGEAGGGVFVASSMTITNSIIWDNWAAVEGGDGYLLGYGPDAVFSFSYSDMGVDWSMFYYPVYDEGPGVISANPLFATGPGGSWYLSQTAAGQPADSPCVDAGDPGSSLFGTTRTDLQPDGDVLDMGYHFLQAPGMYICHDPAAIYFYHDLGDPPPESVTLEIWRCVTGTLDWTVESTAEWLTLDPLSGSSTGEVDEITVSVDPTGFAVGSERADIVIRAPGALNDPVTIQVTLRIDGPFDHPMQVAGPGPSPDNPPLVRVYDAWFGTEPEHEFLAYGATGYGARVACGDPNGDGAGEIVTGAGPGAVYGPQVRGFLHNGTPMTGLNFLAYGTNKYGVNVSCGDLDGDRFDEIVTGAGPGAVFSPHVRAFSYRHQAVSPVPGVSFFAYGTQRWGVNVDCGDLDGDGMDEIVTGAGPGAVFGPHVRGWNVDGGTAAPMPGISFLAYGSNHFGVNVACGDLDGDGLDEILTAPGPGPSLGAFIRGWNYDGDQLTPIPGCDIFAWPPEQRLYGARVAVFPGGRPWETVMVGGGPDPGADSEVQIYLFDTDTEQLERQLSFLSFDGMLQGADVAGGPLH